MTEDEFIADLDRLLYDGFVHVIVDERFDHDPRVGVTKLGHAAVVPLTEAEDARAAGDRQP